jgi:formamidopyrimidine-DNA glycosylase
MPELPEVETVRRGLSEILPGAKLLNVEIREPKSARGDLNQLTHARAKSLRRFGKMLVIDFDNNFSIAVHLRMTGQLIFRDQKSQNQFAGGHPTDSAMGALPDKSTRVILKFSNGTLFFNDQRKFGFMQIEPTAQIASIPFLQKLGPEPFDANSRAQIVQNIQKHRNAEIKAVLLDQTVIAGLGNIYADESLWLAQIHPATRVAKISVRKLAELIQYAADVMNESIQIGGTTFSDFRNARGEVGEYVDHLRAYGRAGKPCLRCGTAMQKIRIAGRGSTFCPHCQKLK